MLEIRNFVYEDENVGEDKAADAGDVKNHMKIRGQRKVHRVIGDGEGAYEIEDERKKPKEREQKTERAIIVG